MSKTVLKIRRKSDGKILTDIINDTCQVHNIYDGEELMVKDNDYNIGYVEGDGFLDWADYEEVTTQEEIEKINKRLDEINKKLDDIIYDDDDNNGILYSPEESWQIEVVDQLEHIKDIGELSDGYHTFNSLYFQRLYLFAALVKAYKDKAWKTKKRDDGEPCFGGDWFLVGITTPEGDYTYHYELKDWGLFDCKVLEKAPPFDGHTDKDVTRVLSL